MQTAYCPAMLDEDECYAALARHDPAADGVFFVGVRTTGIYCRPVCPARLPRRCNVEFHASAAAAQAAGFRPCLRCRPESAPDSPAWVGSLATINRALRMIDEGALADAGVEALAGRLGMSGRQLRRLFERHVGVGPLTIEQTRRVHLAKKLVHETALPLTDIAFAAGYGSVRRFNEAFQTMFGRPPSALRRAGGRYDAMSPVTVSITFRPDFDWGARSGGEATMIVPLPAIAPDARAILHSGSGRTLIAALYDVPLPALGRAIALAKRVVFGDADALIAR